MTILTSGFLGLRQFQRSTSLHGDVFFDNSCEDRLKDQAGRCPGQAGFIPQIVPVKEEYKDFKSFAAAQKAKKEAAEAAKKSAKK